MPITPQDVLQSLAGFITTDGLHPLKLGYIQDIAVEPHSEGSRINLHVDDVWQGRAVSEAHRAALATFVKDRYPDVVDVRIIPRSKEQAEQARKIGKPGQAPPRTPIGVKMIAVISGKGGVGKSTVSINLAHALAALGYRTGILDCDIYGFSVPDLLHLTDPIKSQERRFIPPTVDGIDVMSMKFFVGHNAPVMWRGPMLGKAIRQMMEETVWNNPEYMVLDLPPGTGDIAMDVHQYFPKAAAILVTTPDVNAARVTERAGQMARSMDRRLLGVVENMSFMNCPECGYAWYPLGQGGADAVGQNLGIPVLAKIPWVIQGDQGVSGLAPQGTSAEGAYRHLAESVAETNLVPTGPLS
jgi:ATP-binding protein involved in chromosome partitioning